MNKKLKRAGAVSMLCLILFSLCGMDVSAQIDEDAVKKEEEKIRAEKEKEKEREQVSLTPDGNLTLIDDIDEEHSGSLQFMTVQTRSGNYFYIIVDRDSKEDNVYFLNMVDEADLLGIIPEDERGIYCDGSCMKEEPAVEEPEEAVEIPEEPEEEEPAAPEPEEEEPEEAVVEQPGKKDSKLFFYALVLLLGGGAVAAYYFIKIRPGKQDMDFYDDAEYENGNEEPEFDKGEGYGGDDYEDDDSVEDQEDEDLIIENDGGKTIEMGSIAERRITETAMDEPPAEKKAAAHEPDEDPGYKERMANFMEQLSEAPENDVTDERSDDL